MERVEIVKWNKISLAILDKKDINEWYKWLNNIETNLYLWNNKDIYDKENIEDLYEEKIKEKNSVYFSIYNKENKSVIWICAIESISDLTLKAELYLFLYDKNNHNKWYWKEALNLLIDYWFNILWLNKLWLSYIEWNENAEKLYSKSWFKEVWRFKNDIFVRWKIKNLIFMEIYKN